MIPKDIEGQCNAHLYLNDGTITCATARCSKPHGHEGAHEEMFERNGLPVIITWYVDEREDDAFTKYCKPCLETNTEWETCHGCKHLKSEGN